MDMQKTLVDNFFRYVNIPSQSNPSIKEVPSTKGQFTLARVLEKELIDLGFEDVYIDEHCILTGVLKGNCKGDSVGFVSHLDTVDVSLSDVIKPQIIHYEGGDVVLNKDKNIIMKLSEHQELNDYIGSDIIFSDGTSVLGADNKAAMANVMTAFEYIVKNNVKHGDIHIAFVPDEEIGLRGSKLLERQRFNVDYAYTIDCCKLGEIVYETFNAGSALIKITGVSAHPMSAKGVLVNPILVAHDFISMFDREQTPECTDKKDGYWWVIGIKADQSKCNVTMHVRDFDKDNYRYRMNYIKECVAKLKEMYPRAQVELELEDIYANIANNVTRDDKPVAMLYEAAKALDIKPITIAMRGGTDGSALSPKGIITPNYFTGAHNFHSNCEFLPIPSFNKSLAMTLKLIEMAAS